MNYDAKSPAQLLQEAQQASAALDRAREDMRREKTPSAAMAYCRAFQAAKQAREALPKMRAV